MFRPCRLYETLTEALQTEAFHHSLWPGQISCSGHAGYMKHSPKHCKQRRFIIRCGQGRYHVPAMPVI
ncbi:hypothetical protein HRM2_32010 [Desulforapulum autotrophicum HRM2]|uniref:Uncharacterized protein n=1 Tax=Desulforapulum autotrophicum (strain ATCC 43914 / DSM 3382 / VKM B-1955 / HRM2) TaxID=177437 RepID=C0QLH8_DESAH|nr:hypothetical protein HRM2_32010 [Desulforapulum autotrophicum HRM2]